MPDIDIHSEIAKMQSEVKDEAMAAIPAPLSYADLEALDLPGTQWLLGKTIPWPGLIAVSGRPGSYKTFFSLWMSLRMSAGLPLFDGMMDDLDFGKPSEPCGVLFIEEENTLRLIRERVLSFKRADYSRAFFYVDCGFKMIDEAWRLKTLEFVRANGIKVIVLDPFSSVMGFRDENNNAEVSEVMDIVRKEFIKNDISVIFIHHPSKGDGDGKNLRGAGDILGKCDVHLSLEKAESGEITVSYEKMRVADESTMHDFVIKLDKTEDGKNQSFSYVRLSQPKWVEERDGLRMKIEDIFRDGKAHGRKEVSDEIGESNSGKKFSAVWSWMVEEKVLNKVGKNEFIFTGTKNG